MPDQVRHDEVSLFNCRFNFYKQKQKKGPDTIRASFRKITDLDQISILYTHPVGFGRPAILQAPFPGPDGKSS